jgi:hypothetical protein
VESSSGQLPTCRHKAPTPDPADHSWQRRIACHELGECRDDQHDCSSASEANRALDVLHRDCGTATTNVAVSHDTAIPGNLVPSTLVGSTEASATASAAVNTAATITRMAAARSPHRQTTRLVATTSHIP